MAYDNNDGRLRGRKLQAARLRIWSNNPHCARCGKLVAFPGGFELDHITALHKEGSTNDDENMQVLCPSCHQALHKAAEGDDVNDDSNLQVLCVEWPSPGVKAGCHVMKSAEDMGYAKRAAFDAQGRVVW